jgi:hypothetical protein
MDSGRQLLMTRLRDERSRRPQRRWRFTRPAAFLFGGLAFGAITVGAAASTGAGLDRSLASLLAEIGVPGVADDKVEGLPARGNGEGVPPKEGQQGGTHENVPPAQLQNAPEGTQGDEVTDAVSDAIDASEPGPGRGEEVREAACGAARTLPPQAQGQGAPPATCPEGENGNSNEAVTPGNGAPQDPGQGNGPPDDPGQGNRPPADPGPPAG